MNWIPLLLADRSPSLRLLVLRDLMGRKQNDEEIRELESLRSEDPVISTLLLMQQKDGSWKNIDGAGITPGSAVRATSLSLLRLAYVGFPKDHSAIKKGVDFIFQKQRETGEWPMPGAYDGIAEPQRGYTMAPLQVSIPLLGIAASGYATDTRAEFAYEWLLEQRLEDGAWPTGTIGEVYGYQAGYRKMPHSRWGCRTNTTLALTCLAFHPTRRTSEPARRALDMLLARETRDKQNIGFNVARTIGYEQHRGHITFHARFDPGLVLDLCWRIGANRNDERVDGLVGWMLEQLGPYGLWEYERKPEASRWVTFDILRSLSKLDEDTEWIATEPRTVYKSYSSRPKRF